MRCALTKMKNIMGRKYHPNILYNMGQNIAVVWTVLSRGKY